MDSKPTKPGPKMTSLSLFFLNRLLISGIFYSWDGKMAASGLILFSLNLKQDFSWR